MFGSSKWAGGRSSLICVLCNNFEYVYLGATVQVHIPCRVCQSILCNQYSTVVASSLVRWFAGWPEAISISRLFSSRFSPPRLIPCESGWDAQHTESNRPPTTVAADEHDCPLFYPILISFRPSNETELYIHRKQDRLNSVS